MHPGIVDWLCVKRFDLPPGLFAGMALLGGSKLSGVQGRRTPAYAPGKSETGIFPNWLYLRPASPLAGTHSEPNVKRLSCGRWAALAFLHDPQDEANQARYHTRAWLTQAV